MHGYTRLIVEISGCRRDEARVLEIIMRDFVVGHPLDSLSRAEFRSYALEALALWRTERHLFEQHFEEVKRAFRGDRGEP